jgi:hypothetical protein
MLLLYVNVILRVQSYYIFRKKHKNKHKISLKTCTIRNNYVILQPETPIFGD